MIEYDLIEHHYLPWLIENGYTSCEIVARASYKGSIWPCRWMRATKSGQPYFIVQKNLEKKASLEKLEWVLRNIPNAAKIDRIVSIKSKLLVFLEEVVGFRNLWEIEDNSELPMREDLKSALNQLIQSLLKVRWVHGDLRPWNIFFNPMTRGFSFIDWWSSRALTPDEEENDRRDSEKVLTLFDGKDNLENIWKQQYFTMTWNPPWVKRESAPYGVKPAG